MEKAECYEQCMQEIESLNEALGALRERLTVVTDRLMAGEHNLGPEALTLSVNVLTLDLEREKLYRHLSDHDIDDLRERLETAESLTRTEIRAAVHDYFAVPEED